MKRLNVILIILSILAIQYTVGQANLNAKIIGKGHPIVFIPGLTCSGDVWNGVAKDLSKKFECHLITLPGFAGNKAFKELDGNFMNLSKKLILSYIEENKLSNPIIIGHSLGGVLALKIAIDNPKLPKKLVIVDAFPFMMGVRNPNISDKELESVASKYKTNMLNNWKKPLVEKTKSQKQFLKFMISDSLKINVATRWYLDSDINSVAQAMYELNKEDLRNGLENIKVPTLVLGSWIAGKPYGATKESSLELYKTQYKKLKNAEFDMSESGKHFIMWDDPVFFVNKLWKFFN